MNKPLIAITGASSGIGKATAIEFSKKGYPLLLMARRVELLEALKLPNTICQKVDVQNYEEFAAAIKVGEAKYGPVDLLINNAGIMPLEKIYDQPLTDQYALIDINVKGVLNGIHTVINQMKDRRHGTIMNVSSVAGRYTYTNHSVYCATKYAVNAVSEQMRKEVGPFNVRVTLIEPGIVDTNLLNMTKNQAILDGYNANKKSINNGLTPAEFAPMLVYAYELPQHVCIKELMASATDDTCA